MDTPQNPSLRLVSTPNPFDPATADVDDLRPGTWDEPDTITIADARSLSLPTGSVGLALTAPPTFTDFDPSSTDDQHTQWTSYVGFLAESFAELWRVLEAGGRVAIVIDPAPGVGHVPIEAAVISLLQRSGFCIRGCIVWAKSHDPHPLSSAVIRGPHDPPIIGVTERIIFASKLSSSRRYTANERRLFELPADNTISADQWALNRLDLWSIPPPEAGPLIHEHPFPIALAERIIETHTYSGELVLDSMCGTGTTAIAAHRLGRRYYASDIDPVAIDAARHRIAALTNDSLTNTTAQASATRHPANSPQQLSFGSLDCIGDEPA